MVKTLEQINQEFMQRFTVSCPEKSHFSADGIDIFEHFGYAESFENHIREELLGIPADEKQRQADANPFVRIPNDAEMQIYSEKSFADSFTRIRENNSEADQYAQTTQRTRQMILILCGAGIAAVVLDGLLFLILSPSIWLFIGILITAALGFFALWEYYGLGKKKLRKLKSSIRRLNPEGF